VFGYALEKWNHEVDKGWATLDSCYGFVGDYDENEGHKNNHYIVDEFVKEIMKQLHEGS
jgi:hypothetical protein